MTMKRISTASIATESKAPMLKAAAHAATFTGFNLAAPCNPFRLSRPPRARLFDHRYRNGRQVNHLGHDRAEQQARDGPEAAGTHHDVVATRLPATSAMVSATGPMATWAS